MWSSFKTVNSEIDLFTVYDAILAGEQTAITPLIQTGGFPTFATTLNISIDIIHSTENKTT